MRRSNFALRLQPSLLEELRKAAEVEGVALNQLFPEVNCCSGSRCLRFDPVRCGSTGVISISLTDPSRGVEQSPDCNS